MVQSVSGPPPAPIDLTAAGVPAPQTPAAPSAPPATPNATASATPSPAPTPEAAPPVDPTKVVVEPGANKDVLVFKLLDRATGAVLSEIPNQTPQQAADNPAYKSGALLNQQV